MNSHTFEWDRACFNYSGQTEMGDNQSMLYFSLRGHRTLIVWYKGMIAGRASSGVGFSTLSCFMSENSNSIGKIKLNKNDITNAKEKHKK